MTSLKELEAISLDACPVDASGLVVLNKLTPSHGLGISLRLDDTTISDSDLVHIGKLRNVRWLSLNRTRITDDGLVHLHGLPKLIEVSLIGTAVTDNGIADLKKATPTLREVITKPEDE